ncbi:MAG: hypothetical protein QF907_01405 [Nitrospinota bacterium]|nr:hypothetical protein [Nitrospinota bacterium]MDP7555014.1 hypothetical protein [Nitrospinota bacterium]MDP7579934.1 hypothetical protein [Nitrospinota bacterium]HJN02234.1 hypothetical protein [Nitrospinota bacterium]
MKYRQWDSKTKANIVLGGLHNNVSFSELCNWHQIMQSTYYYLLKEFETKSS